MEYFVYIDHVFSKRFRVAANDEDTAVRLAELKALGENAEDGNNEWEFTEQILVDVEKTSKK